MPLSDFVFIKIDIVEHSILVAEGRAKQVWEILDDFHAYVESVVTSHGGRIWGWQGDGGLCVLKTGAKCERVDNAVQAALKILRGVSPFDLQLEPFNGAKTRIKIRIAVHLGTARPQADTGNVHSPDINLVAHLEREALPNSIVITNAALTNCDERTRSLFKPLAKVRAVEFYGQRLWVCDFYGPRKTETWEKVLAGTGILFRKITTQNFKPDIVVGCGRSAGIVGAILAGNFNQPNFVVLSRRKKRDGLREIEFNPIAILNPDRSKLERSSAILLAFYEINSCKTLQAYLAYLRNDAGFKLQTFLVATLYLNPSACADIERSKLRNVWAYKDQPEWDETPWKLSPDWKYL